MIYNYVMQNRKILIGNQGRPVLRAVSEEEVWENLISNHEGRLANRKRIRAAQANPTAKIIARRRAKKQEKKDAPTHR